jgi:membrane protease YdiL (CAAX protease family)
MNRLAPGPSALLEVGIMFLPAIPAYIWLWPNVQGTSADITQAVVDVYVLAGTLFIGLRRWRLADLGINRKGIWLSLVCTLVIILARFLIIRSIDWKITPPPVTVAGLVVDLFYYFVIIGLVEELLFRGLVYRALENWRGVRWAIWGSSFGFMLWHIFGQGPLAGMATFLIGLLFAVIRWRAGGIIGLIILHGFWDFETVRLISADNTILISLSRPDVLSPVMMWLGALLLFAVPLYLLVFHPKIIARKQQRVMSRG